MHDDVGGAEEELAGCGLSQLGAAGVHVAEDEEGCAGCIDEGELGGGPPAQAAFEAGGRERIGVDQAEGGEG